MKIKYTKFDDFYAVPNRSHDTDAGADVYAAEKYWLHPHSSARVPLGIGLEIPNGYMGIVQCRSGLSSKGIICNNAIIDSGYTGEIHAIMTNTTSESYFIKRGDRVGQLVIMPVIIADYVEEFSDTRGNSGFGSTGK